MNINVRYLVLFFFFSCFFFNDTATTEIYTLSLHDALPILAPVCLDAGIAGCATGQCPIGLVDIRKRAHHGGDRDASPQLLDVLEGPPVEVLTAEERLLPIHDEVLGMHHAPGQFRRRVAAHFDSPMSREPVKGLRVGLVELLFGEEPDPHPALCRGFYRFDDAFQGASGGVAGVELG